MEGFPVVWLWSQGLAPCFKLTKREKTLSRDLLLFLIYYLVFTKYFTSETDVYTPTDQIRVTIYLTDLATAFCCSLNNR